MSNNKNNKESPVRFSASQALKRCRALKAAGSDYWWVPAISFGWPGLRLVNNCHWGNIMYTDELGVSSNMTFRVLDEIVSGSINPLLGSDVVEMNSRVKAGGFKVEARGDKKATLNISKWNVVIKATDTASPGDDKLSSCYELINLVSEAFNVEASERLDRGIKLGDLVKKMKGAKPEDVYAAFCALEEDGKKVFPGTRSANDTIITKHTFDSIKKMFPGDSDLEIILRHVLTWDQVSISTPVQTKYSDKNTDPKLKNKPMPNPVARIALNFAKPDEGGQPLDLKIYDKTKPFRDNEGNTKYEVGKVGNEPIVAANVHKFIPYRSSVSGIISMSLCISKMGISIPTKAMVIVIEPGTGRSEFGTDDVFSGDSGNNGDSGNGDSAPAAPVGEAPAEEAQALDGGVDAEDIDNLANELQGL